MEIKLDRENNKLRIDDNMKFTYWMLRFAMICNIISASLNIFTSQISEWNILTWIWILTGLFSIFILFYIFKFSTAEVIPLDDIQHPVPKNFFGRKRLSLKLKNGKTRHLPTKSIKEIEQIQNFIYSPQKVTN